jgi:hypothetical protein
MSTALATFKRDNGIATHRKTGAGHRYAWMAFFATITMKDGTVRWFNELANEYSMEMLTKRHKIAEACDEIAACQILAAHNGIPWPADEPKKRKSKP